MYGLFWLAKCDHSENSVPAYRTDAMDVGRLPVHAYHRANVSFDQRMAARGAKRTSAKAVMSVEDRQ
jgi:hypothetical protein